MKLLSSEIKNKVLQSMIRLMDEARTDLFAANKKDLDTFDRSDRAMYDRLVVDDAKVTDMIRSVKEVKNQEDPVNAIISERNLENGLQIINKTAPFGTIMIIYESRPDVTIEAAVLAFKANNKILLKGGKEALHSNRFLVQLWHQALKENGLEKDWIELLELDRTATRAYLADPPLPIDLIVPRGGERLIQFVKENANCAVLVSGRGNNFIYIDKAADWKKTVKVIVNAKTHKISACNALDKILINRQLPDYEIKLTALANELTSRGVELLVDQKTSEILHTAQRIRDEAVWYEEFLAMKCCMGTVADIEEAIEKINKYSGGHSAGIMTADTEAATHFMEQVDCAAVYQNASTRFTDGGQMGVGAELAISTDKLHHRGPLGLQQLVTNKYYVFGQGHIRE